MKPLTEFINESLKWNDWKIASKTSKYIAIEGRPHWSFQSKEYRMHEDVKCGNWYAGTNGTILIFWSPESTWMPYVYIQEVENDKTNWALVEMDKSLTDPSAVCTKILDHFDDYCGNVGTISELDKIDIPANARRMLSLIKEQ